MLGRCHKTGSHRVVVEIVQLLEHHFVGNNRLGVESLLPNLVGRGFVGRAVIAQLIEQPIALFLGQALQDAACREFLEVGHDAA